MKKQALIDLPVLLIFFNRPETFAQVFNCVKEARPSKLFLACDGARIGKDGEDDKVKQCKTIAEDIDWECEVYTNYSNENLGCGMRPQTAISWALSIVDRIVILEDDCIPDISFFEYMRECLEQYKDDERVGMISGLNHFKDWDCGKYSYCFTRNGAIWGWGTWRRVWKKYDYSVSAIKDDYVQRLYYENISGNDKTRQQKVERLRNTTSRVENGDTLSYWDFQFGFLKITNSYLAIVPKHNLICNIGVGEGSTHFSKIVTDKWEKGMLYFMPTESVETPLIHPPVVMCDYSYTNDVDKVFGYPNFFAKNYGRIKRVIKKIRGGMKQ